MSESTIKSSLIKQVIETLLTTVLTKVAFHHSQQWDAVAQRVSILNIRY